MSGKWTLVNHDNDTEREIDSEPEAKAAKADFESVADVELIPPDEQEAAADGGTETIDPPVVDNSEPDPTDSDSESEPTTQEQSVAKPVQVEPSDIDSQEQFVTEVKGVPRPFMVNMGTPQNKQIHIKKEGYYYLASESGIDVQTEPLNPTWEGDSDTSAFKAIASKGNRVWSNVGTAHQEGEDMRDAEYNLDELASTRAACRVLSMATGAGVTSAEEMVGGGE